MSEMNREYIKMADELLMKANSLKVIKKKVDNISFYFLTDIDDALSSFPWEMRHYLPIALAEQIYKKDGTPKKDETVIVSIPGIAIYRAEYLDENKQLVTVNRYQ